MGRTAQISLSGLKVRVFTSSGTWVAPAYNVEVMVVAIGGGGGAGSKPTPSETYPGSAGGSTSFGALVTAQGGGGGVAEGLSPSTVGYSFGGKGDPYNIPGISALGFLSIGQGGCGYGGYGGNAGGVSTYFGVVTAGTSISVTVGAGGEATENKGPRKGSAGAVLLFYWPA